MLHNWNVPWWYLFHNTENYISTKQNVLLITVIQTLYINWSTEWCFRKVDFKMFCQDYVTMSPARGDFNIHFTVCIEVIYLGESILKQSAIKLTTFEDVISGFHSLRWSEVIHQLVSLRFTFTRSWSLCSGFYIFLHSRCLEDRHNFTSGRSMLW